MRNKHKYRSFFCLLFLLIGISCGKDEVLPDAITLTLQLVYDDQGVSSPASGAKIYLFSDPADVDSSASKITPINAIDSTVSIYNSDTKTAEAKLNISTKEKYYMWIYYKDANKNVILYNDGYRNPIDSIPKGLNVTVRVKLSPINGPIVFWSSNPNEAFPIIIRLGSKDSVQLNNSGSDNAVMINKRFGSFKYEAKNAKDCKWTGNVVLDKNHISETISLDPCTNEEIIFWSGNQKQNVFPVTIKVNDDVIGSIQGPNSGFTCSNSDRTNILSVYKEKGHFTYFASSGDGKCVWTGTFDVSGGGCEAIELTTCK